ncbi:CoA transferase [Tepidiforma sp.]|uniref:CaiB/BaiF CoA transferase family protein n=1 Tax=Tepidiforma sp. TaxID=2682230 RepID=UPI002ADD3AC7|nr:CoA transferase [Tepidiforma sp.]
MKRLPLEGIRIADLTMMWAGPYATRILAEMGAEVIKIESPRAWDNIRTLIPQPGVEEPWNSSYYFNDYNRDKKSLTLDLAHPLGRETFLRLVPLCDVVIENYRADVLDNLRLGYDVLRQARPDIILVSMAGFGKTGPERNHVGFGPIIEQMSGLASLTGYGDDGVPFKTGISYGDPVAGKAAAFAVILALLHRRKTGQGACIDLAQREVLATLIGEAFVAASLRGESPVHRGNRDPRAFAQGVYRCAGQDQWLALTLSTRADWEAAARALGIDPSLPEPPDHDEIDRRLAAALASLDPQDAFERLARAGIPAGRVLDTLTIHDDPHLAARRYWAELPHPRMHPWKQPRSAWRLREADPWPRRHAPLFGEHNDEILQGLLGLSAEQVEELRREGVIGEAPVNPGVG